MALTTPAQTALNPMLLAAIEHNEPPQRRLVDDDLAVLFLPTWMRWLVGATRWALLRRVLIAGSERTGPGLWANLTCRKRFIGDQLEEALDEIDAVVILGAGMDTRAYQLARRTGIPVFEVDLPSNITRKAATVRRVLGTLPPQVRLVAVDFERDDLLTALAEHDYRTEWRVLIICEGVTQYLTEQAVRTVLAGLRACARGSRLVFTYVRRDFIDGDSMYGSPTLYHTVRRRRPLWKFGLQPAQVREFLAPYGWSLQEQIGAEQIRQRYIAPTGRTLPASDLEWSVCAEMR